MNCILLGSMCFAALALAGFSIGIACLAVAIRENQIRRAWKQRREACIHWLENPSSDLPETFRE